jgi:hypothetical protein
MRAEVWPTFGLRATTRRLTLRLPDDGELARSEPYGGGSRCTKILLKAGENLTKRT